MTKGIIFTSTLMIKQFMTDRRNFMKQMTATGILTSMPNILYSQQEKTRTISEDKSIVDEDNFYVGWSEVDITPDRPVALIGQLHKRISKSVQDPLKATILALEIKNRDGKNERGNEPRLQGWTYG